VLAAVATVAALQAQTPARADSPYAHWLNEDVVYIIAAEERAAFERLNTNEEREHFIEQFWLRRDPTPGTPANEFKKEHYRRIGYAMERFRSPTKSGWATERGNLYIVTGPPDEIEAHPAELYEIWRYRDGRELEFRGKEYESTRSKPAR
jgi:GWxTD domain-containing protein